MLRRLMALAGTIGLWGCAREEPAPLPSDQSLSGRLLSESEALREFLSPLHLAMIAGAIGAAILAGRAVRFGTFLLWRIGLDTRRRLPVYGTAINALLVGLVLLFTLHRLAIQAPVLTAVLLVLAITVLLGVYATSLQNVGAGIVLGLRRHLREGDHVFVRDFSGVVQEVGLLSTRLKASQGAVLVLPNRVLNREIVKVERRQPGVPLEIELRLPGAAPADLPERARTLALLSPYQAAAADVHVELTEDGTRLRLHTRVWEAERGLEDAQRYLLAKLRQQVAADAEGDAG